MTSPDNSSLKIPMLVKKIICFLIGYFDGQVNRFRLNSTGDLYLSPVLVKERTPFILIFARRFYQETAQNYPIENTKELKKLLALELASQQNSYYHIWGKENGQSKVNQWKFQEHLPKSWFNIPESLLFALNSHNGQITHIQTTPASFITRVNGVVYSVPQSNIITSNHHFSMSVGVSSQQVSKVIDENNFASSLAQSIKKLPASLFARFINLPKTENKQLQIKQLITPVIVILTSYILLTSVFLNYKQSQLEQKIAIQSKEVSNALDLQQRLEQKNLRYIELKEFFAKQQTSSGLWLTLVNVFPHAIIHNIRKSEDRYIVRGMTSSATNLLELVSTQANVVDARFDLPITKNKGKETFIISFKMNDNLIDPSKVNSVEGMMNNG